MTGSLGGGALDLSLSGYESLHADQEAGRWNLWVGGESSQPTNRRRSRREEDEKVVHDVSAASTKTKTDFKSAER